MDATSFDPQSFLDATLSAPSERRIPLPVECPGTTDGLYTAIIGEVKARVWDSKKADAKVKSGIAWDVPLDLQIPDQIQRELKYSPTFTLKDSVMLNLNDQGMIDNAPGRNPRLRMYREAADLNKPGDVFSAKLLQGKVVKVKISHEMYQNAPFERVDNVLRAA